MKKITSILAGILLCTTAGANDLSQKFYAGINLGGSFATLSKTMKEMQATAACGTISKKPFSGDVHFGKRFGVFGVELSGGYLDKMTDDASVPLNITATDYLVGLDLGYYHTMTEEVSLRGTVGIGGMYTKNSIELISVTGSALATQLAGQNFTGSDSVLGYNTAGINALVTGKNNNSQFKIAPKVGVGVVFAVHQNVSLSASANFIWPISADNVKYLINANVGANYHF